MSTRVIAIIGKAGSGKDSIATLLQKTEPNKFHNIISHTTRPKREGEENGVNYFFLTKEEFLDQAQRGEMIETTEFNDWYYGTSIKSLSKDKVNIGVFNPEGVRSLKSQPDIEVWVCYIYARAKTRLLRQLKREDDPDVKEIIRRFSADEADFFELGFQPEATIVNNTDSLCGPIEAVEFLLEANPWV